MNRLNKTKTEEVVDHEAVRVERERAKGKERKDAAVKEVRYAAGVDRLSHFCPWPLLTDMTRAPRRAAP